MISFSSSNSHSNGGRTVENAKRRSTMQSYFCSYPHDDELDEVAD